MAAVAGHDENAAAISQKPAQRLALGWLELLGRTAENKDANSVETLFGQFLLVRVDAEGCSQFPK